MQHWHSDHSVEPCACLTTAGVRWLGLWAPALTSVGKAAIFAFVCCAEVHLLQGVCVSASLANVVPFATLTPQPEELRRPVSCGSCVWHLGRQTCACCAVAVIYVHAGFLSAENPGKARAGYLTFGVLRGLWELIRASRLVTQWMTQFLISRSCQWNGTD